MPSGNVNNSASEYINDFNDSFANINILPARKRVVHLTLDCVFTAIYLSDEH